MTIIQIGGLGNGYFLFGYLPAFCVSVGRAGDKNTKSDWISSREHQSRQCICMLTVPSSEGRFSRVYTPLGTLCLPGVLIWMRASSTSCGTFTFYAHVTREPFDTDICMMDGKSRPGLSERTGSQRKFPLAGHLHEGLSNLLLATISGELFHVNI